LNITNRHHEPTAGALALVLVMYAYLVMLHFDVRRGLIKLMWTGLPLAVDGALESSSDDVLGLGGGDDLRVELDDESE